MSSYLNAYVGRRVQVRQILDCYDSEEVEVEATEAYDFVTLRTVFDNKFGCLW